MKINELSKKFAQFLETDEVPETLRSPISEVKAIQPINDTDLEDLVKVMHINLANILKNFKYQQYEEALELSSQISNDIEKMDNLILQKIDEQI